MSKEQVLAFLETQRNQYLSGEVIAQKLGLTRAAVWKDIRALREDGYPISSKPSCGYCLEEPLDALSEAKIREALWAQTLGSSILIYPTVDSTNDELRRLASQGAAEGTVLLAEEQTAGKGRLGRSFHSPRRNGVYLSFLLRPNLPFSQVHFLTMLAAVAVSDAVEEQAGFRPQIKWVNDLLWQGKKLCGILSEASVEGESGRLSSVVVGIGINVGSTRDFPSLAHNQAVTLQEITGREISRCRLAASILNCFEAHYLPYLRTQDPTPFLKSYRENLCMMGQKILVTQGSVQYPAWVLGLSDMGGLLVRTEQGRVSELTSGEISLRFPWEAVK